ncbi:MAG: Uma2 family endonuclease [Gallionella sp.]|nr:Uma2 family endonuclease [Gallionella sp.]
MALTQEKMAFGAQEYLVWEAEQIDKREYVAGEAYAMVGARRVHVIVTGNLGSALREHLRGTSCHSLIASMKLNIQAMDAFSTLM